MTIQEEAQQKHVPLTVWLAISCYGIFVGLLLWNISHYPLGDAWNLGWLLALQVIICMGMLIKLPAARLAAAWFPVLTIIFLAYQIDMALDTVFNGGEGKYPYGLALTTMHDWIVWAFVLFPAAMLLETPSARRFFSRPSRWSFTLDWRWAFGTCAAICLAMLFLHPMAGVWGFFLSLGIPLNLVIFTGAATSRHRWLFRTAAICIPLVLLTYSAFLPFQVHVPANFETDMFGPDQYFSSHIMRLLAIALAPEALTLLLFPAEWLLVKLPSEPHEDGNASGDEKKEDTGCADPAE